MIFGSFPKSHVLFGAKSQNGLGPGSCRTVWREQYLPRGGWRQTEKSRTVWRELFLQIWRRTVWRGLISLQPMLIKVLGALAPSALLGTSCRTLWRQVIFWAIRAVPFGAKWSAWHLWPNCMLKEIHAFLAWGKESNEFLLQTKQYVTCLRQMTHHVLYSLS